MSIKNRIVEVVKSKPLDIVAARVMSKGEHFEFQPEENRQSWKSPPPLHFPVPESIKPLINTRKCRMTCIGYLGSGKRTGANSGKKRNNLGAVLLVRCDCGIYEPRHANKWRKAVNAMCQFCIKLEGLKKRSKYK